MTDKLSRRYFTKLFTLGAVAAAVGGHAVLAAKEAVAEALPKLPETVDEGIRIVTTKIQASTRKLRVTWTGFVEKGALEGWTMRVGGDEENS